MRLAKVDPARILVRETMLVPTRWDHRAIFPDLIEYVSLTRTLPGIPRVGIADKTLILINGLPFLRAARDAQPPLEVIVCRIDEEEVHLRDFGLEEIRASDLLLADPPDRVREDVQILHFQHDVDERKRRVAESVIENFFTQMITTTEHGGNYQSLGGFEWNEGGDRLVWRWVRSAEEGRHKLLFIDALKNISTSVCPLRSWNGLAFDFELPAVRDHNIRK